MKTKIRLTMVFGIMTIAIVTVGVPSGRQERETNKTPGIVKGCYTEQEVHMLMQVSQCQRIQAIELLEFSCQYAITAE